MTVCALVEKSFGTVTAYKLQLTLKLKTVFAKSKKNQIFYTGGTTMKRATSGGVHLSAWST